MRKFRLKKCYPDSPELGTIIINDDKFKGYWYIEGVKHIGTIKPWNYPEFWEEVVEKDYEILSFWCKQFNYELKSNNYKNLDFDYLINAKMHYDIHSVKRKSDSEIFTIGDNTNFGKIQSFNIKDSNKLIIEYYRKGDWQYLNSVQKIKKPLFISEDSKEIFEGDEFWFVNKNLNFKPTKSKNYVKNSRVLYFSTKEAAENYILMNKPVLSLKDVINHFSLGYWNDLEKLVKQRL